MMRRYTLVFTFFFLLLSACNSDRNLPDISGIDAEVKIERFDQDISALRSADVFDSNSKWQAQYADFYTDYLYYMLEIGDPADSIRSARLLSEVIENKDFKALSAAVAKKYPSLKAEEKELTTAFKYLKYYFPAYELPRFVSFFSGFAVQVPIGENYIGIGLDMFLGSDSEFYPALVKSIPMYISRRFTPENITPRVVETVLRQELIEKKDTDVNTLQHMVYEGKVLLALDSILPTINDSLKIGYTSEQLLWAEKYQPEIWSWFLEENLLYSTDHQRIQKYFTEAPFTAELGENNESAPKLGVYLGWKLVKKYMEQNPQITLMQLLKNEDAQQILNDSKFKGK